MLAVADIVASLREKPDLLAVKLAECYSAERLEVRADTLEQVLVDCNAEMTALKEALGY